MKDLDKTQMQSAYALVSVMFLAAAISGASLIRAETKPAEGHSFVGTMPEAAVVEVQPPTF